MVEWGTIRKREAGDDGEGSEMTEVGKPGRSNKSFVIDEAEETEDPAMSREAEFTTGV